MTTLDGTPASANNWPAEYEVFEFDGPQDLVTFQHEADGRVVIERHVGLFHREDDPPDLGGLPPDCVAIQRPARDRLNGVCGWILNVVRLQTIDEITRGLPHNYD